MSLSQLYPTVNPSLLLDFAASGVLDPRVTFTRSTTAVYYDGVTTAIAEQNLLLQSQTFDTANWSKQNATITANSTAAPDGTTTADTLTDNATNSWHIVYISNTVTTGVYTISVYLKANTGTFGSVSANWNGQGSGYGVVVDLSTGAFGSELFWGGGTGTYAITAAGNGWYRVSITVNAIANVYTLIATSNSATPAASSYALATYAGTGASIFIWGAQLEQRSSVTAYTATTTAPITTYQPVLLTAPANTARFDHDPLTETALGLLIEEARTNLLLQSQDFSTASWAELGNSILANAIVAPNGTVTGNKVIVDDGVSPGGNFYFYQNISKAAAATTYTVSFYAKAGEYDRVRILVNDNSLSSNNAFATWSLIDGTVVEGPATEGTFTAPVAASQNVGNGWWRVALTFRSSTETVLRVRLYTRNSVSATGNGYSGIYVWGAQMEVGGFASTYIATVAATQTRTAEVAALTGTNFSSWYQRAAGTIYTTVRFRTEPAFVSIQYSQRPFDISNGTVTNRISCFREESSALDWIRLAVNSLGTLVVISNTTNTTNNLDYKICIGYETNNCAVGVAGQPAVTSIAVNLPTVVDRMHIGSASFVPQGFLNGTIKQLIYYPERVTNAQLVALTQG